MVLEDNHYLFRLRAACIRQPEWNAHQLAALDHLMVLAHEAHTLDEFLRESGDLLVLARATSLDRAANLRGSALRCDDPWLAGAASVEYLQALEGAAHREFYAALLEAQAQSSWLRTRSVEVNGAIERLFEGLLRLRTAVDWTGELAVAVEADFRTLLDLDPDFRPDRWWQVNRYRWRLPWACERVAEWLSGYWPAVLPGGELLPEGAIELQREQWFASLRHFDGVWPEVTPIETAAWPEANVWPERQVLWRSATLAGHVAETGRLTEGACTAIAREAISTERWMDFGVEAVWSRLLMSSLLAPLRAAMEDELFHLPVSAATRARAVEELSALVGLGPRALLQVPAVVTFLEYNLNAEQDGLGALQGEAGLDLLRLVAELRARKGRVDVEGLFAGPDAMPQPLPVIHRGVELPLDQYRG